MKVIVLDHPRVASGEHFNDIANTPLWSCLLGRSVVASLQQAGAQVSYLDHTGPGNCFASSADRILSSSPAILAVNAVYFWEHTAELFVFLEKLKDDGFNGHVNVFGFFPTLVYREILASLPNIDVSIRWRSESANIRCWRCGRVLPLGVIGLVLRDWRLSRLMAV